MRAQLVFDLVPIGSIVAWSDGTPRPPERYVKKLAAWRNNNARGRLIAKVGESRIGNVAIAACFTLHKTDLGCGGVTVIRVHRTFSVASAMHFTVVERPAMGTVRVFDRPGPRQELVHLAANRTEAEAWVSCHGPRSAVLDEVGRDETTAPARAGRAA